jgi:SNF2 family DNA or RNA helicase
LTVLDAKSYGRAVRDDSGWHLSLEPQVAVRVKGVFPRLASGRHDEVVISDSLEVCRDLEWFLLRFPIEMSPADRAYLATRATEHRDRIAEAARILSPDYVPPHYDLAVPLRNYQSPATAMILARGALLLGDDVGVGKTQPAIATFTDTRTLPAVVVTLTHLPWQWQREIRRFLPGINTHIVTKGTPYDLTKGLRGRKVPYPDVLITNYHKLKGWAPALAGGLSGTRPVQSVVFDEIHELRRGPNSEKYGAAKRVADACRFKCGLSATPVWNYGGEIWNVMDVLFPGELGSQHEFIRQWCTESNYNDKARIRDPKALGAFLRDQGLFLRRTRRDVGRELPPLQRSLHVVEADPRMLEREADRATELARIILAQGGQVQGAAFKASEELSWRLRQATGLAKAIYVADFVRMLVEAGEKVLVYGWHHAVFDLWKARLRDFHPVMFTGEESPRQKEAARIAFVEGYSKVLMMSLRAGAGIDGLQKVCRTVVFGELDWSPGCHEQCTGRVFRDGQEEPVLAYYLVSETGSDPVVLDVLGFKRTQAEGLRDPFGSVLEPANDDGERVRRLAREYLRQRGVKGYEAA